MCKLSDPPFANRRIVGAAIGSAVAIMLVLLPTVARPCAQPPCHARVVLPADDVHPSNGAIVIKVFEGNRAELEATVDGEPTALVPAGHLPEVVAERDHDTSWPYAWRSYFVDPAPPPGAEVRIHGVFCDEEEWPGTAAVDFTYRAGPPDVTPPAELSSFWFDLFVHSEWRECACGYEGDPAGDTRWNVSAERAAAMEPPGSLELVRVDLIAADGRVLATDWSATTSGIGVHAAAVPRSIELNRRALDVPPEEVCLRATVVDAAGNVTPSIEACPCRIAFDDTPLGPDDDGCYAAPPRPDWSQVPMVAGGHCGDDVIDPPDAALDPPDAVADPPDAALDPPDAVTDPLDAVVDPPDAVDDLRDAVADLQDAVTDLLDTVVNQADAVVSQPDAVTDSRDAIVNPLDAEIDSIDAISNPSDAMSVSPDAMTDPPDAVTDLRDAAADPPDTVADPTDATLAADMSPASDTQPRPSAPDASSANRADGSRRDDPTRDATADSAPTKSDTPRDSGCAFGGRGQTPPRIVALLVAAGLWWRRQRWSE